MELQLKDIIEKIKAEGIESAQAQADEILNETRKKADRIIEEARQKADGIIKDAEEKAAKREEAGRQALVQAGRDLVLRVQQKLHALFSAVIDDSVQSSFTGKTLENAIVSLASHWKEEDEAPRIELPEKEFKELEGSLRARLAETLKGGVEIKPFDDIKAGFRVSEKDGSSYYDFSSAGVAEVLQRFLNPRLAEIMKSSVEQDGESQR
jgi:V/A-type H+/Na+-transporting ATPase subunit E